MVLGGAGLGPVPNEKAETLDNAEGAAGAKPPNEILGALDETAYAAFEVENENESAVPVDAKGAAGWDAADAVFEVENENEGAAPVDANGAAGWDAAGAPDPPLAPIASFTHLGFSTCLMPMVSQGRAPAFVGAAICFGASDAVDASAGFATSGNGAGLAALPKEATGVVTGKVMEDDSGFDDGPETCDVAPNG